MRLVDEAVHLVLRSPLHGLMSGSTDVIRYTGPRTGRRITTPTQYVRSDGDVIILVGRPETKTWWRSFRTDRDLDVLLRRQWTPMRARAVVGTDEPDTIAPLLEAYLKRFPKAARALKGQTDDARARSAVVVWCRPR